MQITLITQTRYENSPMCPRRESFLALTGSNSEHAVRRIASRREEGPTWEHMTSNGWTQLPGNAAKSLEADYQSGDYESIQSLDEREANVRR